MKKTTPEEKEDIPLSRDDPEEFKIDIQDQKKEDSVEVKEEMIKKEINYGSTSLWKGISAIVGLMFIVALFTGPLYTFGEISEKEAENKAVGLVNSLLAGQAVANPVDTSKEYGLYKIILNIDGEDVDAYISPDGKKFFAQPIDVTLFEQLQGIAEKNLVVDPVAEQDNELTLVGNDSPENLEESSEEDIIVSVSGFSRDLIPIKINEEVSLKLFSEDVNGLFRIDDFDISEELVAGEETVVTFTPDMIGVHEFFVEGQGLSGAVVVEA